MTESFPRQALVDLDLAIVGAGPHGLALAARWAARRRRPGRRLAVFDPSGRWLAAWNRQFAALEIPHLRSPAVHHPDPDAFALRRFAESRADELFPPYDLPGTTLFREFCAEVAARWNLESAIVPAAVVALDPPRPGRGQFRLHLSAGGVATARRVVLATNPGRPVWPDWAFDWVEGRAALPPGRLAHASEIDLRQWPSLAGERVAIVGGGLTSGHLALGAAARGAWATLLARRPWRERLFDADPGWLGPKCLKGFAAEPDWAARQAMVLAARDGGSLTPAVMVQLRRLERQGRMVLCDRCAIVRATWTGRVWQTICDDGTERAFDRLWLATGTTFDATLDPLLPEVLHRYPTALVGGWPALDPWCRWPGCELFITGGLAALQLGPAARNLHGARAAGDRILDALTKRGVPPSRPYTGQTARWTPLPAALA